MSNRYQNTDNIDFFTRWSHDMAYILGFYCGDGCITMNNNSWVLNFSIHTKDRCILEFIRQKLNPNRTINDYQVRDDMVDEIRYKSSFKITNEKICKNILSLGFNLRKTYNTNYPDIPSQYKPDFLRGYFDADGCVEDTRKRARFFCLDKTFLEKIKQDTLNRGVIEDYTKNKGTCRWCIGRREDVEALKDYMYNGNFCLPRKYLKFLKMNFSDPPTTITAFGETKTLNEWKEDNRCTVGICTLMYRLQKYGSVLDHEKIITMKGKELWQHITRYIAVSPEGKVFKVVSQQETKKGRPDLVKIFKIITQKRIKTSDGWSIRKIEDESFDVWYKEREHLAKKTRGESIDFDNIKRMWDDNLIKNAEILK